MSGKGKWHKQKDDFVALFNVNNKKMKKKNTKRDLNAQLCTIYKHLLKLVVNNKIVSETTTETAAAAAAAASASASAQPQ